MSSEKNLLKIDDPKQLIPLLCKKFYKLGWVSATGGGISIRSNGTVYIAPSGVQKEFISPEDIFTVDIYGNILTQPNSPELKPSECTPLFLLAYKYRSAGAVLHTHSKHVVKICHLNQDKNEVKFSNLEVLKGIYRGSSSVKYRYDDEITIPIIENTCYEKDLKDSMEEAMLRYPDTNAILVRAHGAYIWGPDWQTAKVMAEAYEYIFEISCLLNK